MPNRSPYAMMSVQDKNMVAFTCACSAILFFDFLIYLYLADVISTTVFSADVDKHFSQIQSLGLFAAGYLARPLGGIFFGRFGDTLGRRPIFIATLMVTAGTMFAMALMPTYAEWGIAAPILFITLRLIQGMAFGVFVPLSWIFVSEHLPRQYLTVGCSYVTASFLLGVLFSNAFFSWLTDTMSPEQLVSYGWRLPFMIAALFSCLPLLGWRYIKESPYFLNMQKTMPNNYEPRPIRMLFTQCRQAIFVTMMLTLVTSSVTLVVVLIMPELAIVNFPVDGDLFNFSHSLGLVFMMIGCVFYGVISSNSNFGKILMIGCLVLILQIFAFFYQMQAGGDYLLIMYALLGFSAGIIGMVPAVFVKLFSTNVRLTGLSIAYNVMYAFVGGVMPFVISHFTDTVSFSAALYTAFICVIGIIMGLYFYHLPEFKRIDHVMR
ncbi:MFS transporter [Psychrobacter aestuarii]|uniref:MFS transporter n=1 Tax=Psychrobacter aestuarii TaxID=556327 RepID=A0ABP3FDX3_9GAMM|nr:MFS transporter [Psychrobacter aestuarii]